MSASLTITGGAEMRYVAGKLRKAAARDLTRQLRAKQREAFKPLQKEIKAEALATLPKRGGYAAIMGRDVRVSVTTKLRGASAITARIYAKGKTEERDVIQVNRGILRHPDIRKGRRVWRTTRVRPGFVDRPIARIGDRIAEKSAEALQDVIDEIARS